MIYLTNLTEDVQEWKIKNISKVFGADVKKIITLQQRIY